MRINIILAAAILGAMAVLIGAFGAHGLAQTAITAKALKSFHTGVEYQFYHVIALLFVGIWYQHKPSERLKIVAWLFIAGILLFSGSLYAYVLTGIRQFAMITPIGGITFVIAWLLLATSSLRDFSGE